MINLYPPSAHNAYNGAQLNFSPEIDNACKEIYEACKGLGTDETALTSVLGPKSQETRNLIALRYYQLYNKSLKSVVESETSGSYGKLLSLIVASLPVAECDMLKSATSGAGTTEKYIFPIVMGRTNIEMNILRKTYFELYNEDLAVLMNNELSGDFKKVVMAALQSPLVDYKPDYHNQAKAEADAEALYKAGEGKWGTNEEGFIHLLATNPPQHIQNMNAVYVKKYNNTITRAVEKEFNGDAEKALVFLTRMILEPLELLAEYFESTMKGFGTDEDGLSLAVVRYKCVLPQIAEAYKAKYGSSLRDRIKGECSGNYATLLLEVYDAPQN